MEKRGWEFFSSKIKALSFSTKWDGWLKWNESFKVCILRFNHKPHPTCTGCVCWTIWRKAENADQDKIEHFVCMWFSTCEVAKWTLQAYPDSCLLESPAMCYSWDRPVALRLAVTLFNSAQVLSTPKYNIAQKKIHWNDRKI